MKGSILITDSLFILKEHEQKLIDAGYSVVRIDKPQASEAELVEAIKGKVGYILGGIEKITDPIVAAADELKVIVFTGADWIHWIPGHEKATAKGIAIANTPGANAYAVAEYTTTIMLAMTRNIFELGRTGKTTFRTTQSFRDLTVGIIGMGNVGSKVASFLHGLEAKEVLYTSRTRKEDVEKKVGARFVDLETLLRRSDIVSLHFSKEAGSGFMDREKLSLMKNGALLINCGFIGAVDNDALLVELKKGRLRAFEDGPAKEDGFNELPLSTWFCSNSHTAYNTHEANRRASDMAVESILNLLEKGSDQHKVN